MEWKAIVRFYGERAYYEVVPDASGIYHARLTQYEGPSGTTPPEYAPLVKGMRPRTGSEDPQKHPKEPGRAIEVRQKDWDGDPSQRPELAAS